MDAPRIKAWQCVGCGRIDGAAPCVGVCRDQAVELVAGRHYDEALARIDALEAALRRIARTQPRAGQWEASFAVMQRLASEALGMAKQE